LHLNVEIKDAIESGATIKIDWNLLRSTTILLGRLEPSCQLGISDTFKGNSVLTFTPMLQPVWPVI